MDKRVIYCKPGKAKQTGPNSSKTLVFKRSGINATTKRNSRIASAFANPQLTAQDVYERNYEKLQQIRMILGR